MISTFQRILKDMFNYFKINLHSSLFFRYVYLNIFKKSLSRMKLELSPIWCSIELCAYCDPYHNFNYLFYDCLTHQARDYFHFVPCYIIQFSKIVPEYSRSSILICH